MTVEAISEPTALVDSPRGFFGTFGMQTLDLLLRVLLQILVVRILIRHWGVSVYQDWIILFAAANFLLVLDCGMQTYFVNSLLIARVTDDQGSFRRHVAIAMTLYLSVLTLTVTGFAALFFLGVRPAILGLRTLDPASVAWVAVLLGGSVLALLPLGIFTGIYRIRGNYSLSVSTSMLTQTLPGFGLCLVASYGGTPVTGAAIYFLSAVVAWLLVAADQRRRYHGFPLSMTRPRRTELKTVVRQSMQYMVSSLSVPVTLQIPVLLLGIWGSGGVVIRYVTTRTLAGLVRQIISQPSLPVGVELARLYLHGDFNGVRRLFADATHLMSGIAGLLCGYLLVVAGPTLRLWTHGEVTFDPWLIAIFVANVMAVAPAQVAQAFFLHINQPRPLIIAASGFVTSALILCTLLIGKWSAIGAALAFAIAEVSFLGAYVPYAACRRIGLPILPYAATCIRLLATGFSIGYGVAWLLEESLTVLSFGGLITTSLLWALIAALPAYLLLLTAKMRSRLKQLVATAFWALLRNGWPQRRRGRL